MEIKQSAKGLYEKGFDEDLSLDELDEMLRPFSESEIITSHLYNLRELNLVTDMKRGELYPEVIGSGTRLRRTIAKVYDIDMVQAQPNFSCNGCIDTFLSYIQRLELIDSRRKGFMVATPTYFRYYHKIDALRLRLFSIPLKQEYEYPIDQLIATLKKATPSCLFLVTPNNPTGIPIPDSQLFEILDNIPEDLNVAIDRTCANIEPEISTKDILKKYPHKNLVIFHSFSKYHGMSHQRIGFSVFANQALASEVDRYLPFGLNLQAVLEATRILVAEGELKPSERILRHIRENIASMKAFLMRNDGYACSDFKSNYAILTLPKQLNSRDFHRQLLEKGIFVMPGHELPTPDDRSVRIHTGGPPLFMNRMLEVIESWG